MRLAEPHQLQAVRPKLTESVASDHAADRAIKIPRQVERVLVVFNVRVRAPVYVQVFGKPLRHRLSDFFRLNECPGSQVQTKQKRILLALFASPEVNHESS